MDLYFGNLTSILSTIFLLTMLVFVGYTFVKNKSINKWGSKIAVLALLGLLVCCLVAVRDGYYLSVQASVDNRVVAGLFTLDSIQSTLCCIGGAIITFSSLSSVFIKRPKYRKAMFFVLSAVIILKMLIIEISRWMA